MWSISADFLLLLSAFALGYAGGCLRTWSLHRRTYSLECAVADLENKVLVEVKRRAGHERQRDRTIDEDILKAAAAKQPAKPTVPWWQNLGANP